MSANFDQTSPRFRRSTNVAPLAASNEREYRATRIDLNTSAPAYLTLGYTDKLNTRIEKAIAQSYFMDMEYTPDTAIRILTTTCLIFIRGRNLADVWKGIREQSAHYLNEYSEALHDAPEEGIAVIERIEVVQKIAFG